MTNMTSVGVFSPSINGTRTNVDNGNTHTGYLGDVFITKITHLAVGIPTYVLIDVTNATGHVRAKVYYDTAGTPTTLMGSSNSVQINTTGWNRIPLNNCAGACNPIHSDGVAWVGFETDDNHFATKALVPGNEYIVAHAYGGGPSPFGGAPDATLAPHVGLVYTPITTSGNIRVKVYAETGTSAPNTLLAESNSTAFTTGWNDLILNTHPAIPANGIVYIAAEVSNNTAAIETKNTGVDVWSVAHGFGTGPSPFGAAVHTTVTGPHMRLGFSGSFITATSFTISGYVLGGTGIFNYPVIKLGSPASANLTDIGLYDSIGLITPHHFSPSILLNSGVSTIIPVNFTDATGRTGIVNYTMQAQLQSGVYTTTVSSNTVSLNYGSIKLGGLSFNYSNPTKVPIWFIRHDVGNNTRLSVIFPNAANLTCNLAYQTAQTNHTYFNIPNVVYDTTQKNSSFLFINGTNDFVKVSCHDVNNIATAGSYVLTLSNFPFVQQIKDFRSGKYGTTGQFGMLDIITLSVVIFSMIGFNRINEGVGAFFSLAIIGATAYFGILTFPGIVLGAVAVVTVLAVVTVRKIGGF